MPGRGNQHGDIGPRPGIHRLWIHTVHNDHVIESKLADIVLQGAPVPGAVLHGDDGTLSGHDGRLHGNGLSGNDTEVFLGRHLHLAEQHSPDLRAHIAHGAGVKAWLSMPNLRDLRALGFRSSMAAEALIPRSIMS